MYLKWYLQISANVNQLEMPPLDWIHSGEKEIINSLFS